MALVVLLGAALLVGNLFGKLPDRLLLPWLLVALSLSMVNMALAQVLLKQLDDLPRRSTLLGVSAVALFLEGLTWGLTPFLFVQAGEIGYTHWLMVYLCAASSLAIHSLHTRPLALWCFLLPCLLPVGLYKSVFGHGLDRMMGLGVLAILVLNLYFGHQAGKRSRRAIRIAVQRDDLRVQLDVAVAELRTALRSIQKMATRDPLTDVYNRRAMLEQLDREMLRQDREGHQLGVLLIDVDHFKQVNEEWGHLAGDRVLAALAQRIQSQLRGSDILARYGGEEFVCIIRVKDEQELLQSAERVRQYIASEPVEIQMEVDEQHVPTSISIGATLRLIRETPAHLFARADAALLAAKANGRNRVESRSSDA